MSCSKEEIERKRLLALQKRQGKLSSSPNKFLTSTLTNTISDKNQNGPIKTYNNTPHKSFHPYAKIAKQDSADNKSVPVGKIVTGTMYLTSEDRFEVNPSEFCAPLIDVFKTIPSKSFDPVTKLWNFSISDYYELMSRISPLAPHIVLGGLPSYVLKVLNEQAVDLTRVDLSMIESTLRNKLMPFQEEGVRFGIAKRGRCMIADDMGLGKTFQALAIASFYRNNWPMLIVTTSSMRGTWQSKIHELLPSVPMMNVVCLTNNKDVQMVADKQTEVVICSYKLTTTHKDILKSKKFGVVIIDESHYLKSHKAQCTGSLTSVCSGASRVILLSGTPALSRPAELYTQLRLIDPTCFGGYTDYGKRYCDGKLTNFGWDMSGRSNLVELQILLQKKFLIRRTKEQVLTELDEKTREQVLLDQSLLEFTKEDKQGLSQMAENYRRTKSSDRHAALLTFFSETAKVKIPAICKYIRQQVKVDDTTKYLLFAHHKNVLDAISSTLDEIGVGYIFITGSTPATHRTDLVDKFQHLPRCRCAVLSITAANAGLTLTAAGVVIFAELHWNPGVLCQAEARAHRLGRQGAVRVRYLCAPHTADDHIWPLLQDKLNVLNEVGLSGDTYENTTSKLQESKMDITQYLSPTCSKNPNDYIPGTNIRKYTMDSVKKKEAQKNEPPISSDDIDKSFLDDEEGDELLANLDL